METVEPSRAGPRRFGQAPCAAALILADCIAFISAVVLAVVLMHVTGRWVPLASGPVADVMQHADLPIEAAVMLGVLAVFARNGHYARRMPFWSILRDILACSLLALLCTGFLEYSSHRLFSRVLLVLTWVAFPILAVLLRGCARVVLSKLDLWALPVLIVGRGEAARQALLALHSEPGLGYRVVETISAETLLTARTLDDPTAWWQLMRRRGAEMLVLALDIDDSRARRLTESLVRSRVPLATMPRLEGLPVLGFRQTCFFSHDTVMFTYRNNLAKPGARAIKIIFDLTSAMLLLLAVLPVLVVIAIAVKLDGGPMLFAHRRVGANGREFPCFKFRSMVPDADAVLRHTLANDPEAAAEWADTRKLRRDPRVTTVGRLLRQTSLDELPQLLNVLRLEMSLVGPRPIVQSEVQRYGSDIAYYYETRPGLTGLWQVSGRSGTSYTQRVQLDTWYVKNWTIWHDVAILAKTVPAVLRRHGAV